MKKTERVGGVGQQGRTQQRVLSNISPRYSSKDEMKH